MSGRVVPSSQDSFDINHDHKRALISIMIYAEAITA